MADSERAHVDVAVALVTDENQRVLLTFNENWGMFTLPMTGRGRGSQGPEPRTRAVLHAAVDVAHDPAGERDVEEQRPVVGGDRIGQ